MGSHRTELGVLTFLCGGAIFFDRRFLPVVCLVKIVGMEILG